MNDSKMVAEVSWTRQFCLLARPPPFPNLPSLPVGAGRTEH